MVKGDNYVEKDEKYDKKEQKKTDRKMKTAGVAVALKESQKKKGYGSLPSPKPRAKMKGLVK